MNAFLHLLGVLFGVAGIACAVAAVMNMLIATAFPKDMIEDAWPYAKKVYIFLGLMLLFIVIGFFLNTL